MDEPAPGIARRVLRLLVEGWVWWALPLVLALVLLLALALLTGPVELLPFVYAPG